MHSRMKLLVGAMTIFASCSVMADWELYRSVMLDGYANSIPGGNYYHELTIPSGVYRFRIDPNSVGVDYATNQGGNTKSKSAALMIYNRTATADQTAEVTYYGLNLSGNLASGIIHAVPQTAGFDLFLQDWARSDNSGSVKVIIEKWKD